MFRDRRAAELCIGYDLAMDNVDQSPFHKNEAGSKDVCSVSLRGAPTVPSLAWMLEPQASNCSRYLSKKKGMRATSAAASELHAIQTSHQESRQAPH